MKDLRKEILEIITYHSDEGTSGYLLNDEQIGQLLALIKKHERRLLEEVREKAWDSKSTARVIDFIEYLLKQN